MIERGDEMNKKINYKLTNKTLPLLPNLHDEKLQEVKIEGDVLSFVISLEGQREYIDGLVGFAAKCLKICAELMDDAACDVEVSKMVAKKMLKEKSKLGYGKKCNIYSIRDFLKIYKGYQLRYNRTLVGSENVEFVFLGQADIEIKFIITCSEIAYTFSN